MKAKKKAGAKTYHMPIARERFMHMLTALVGHIRGLDRERSIRMPGFAMYRMQRDAAGEILDEETAREIADALHKLHGLYCEQALRHKLPNRRVPMRELQDAVNAQWLVDLYGFDPASAMQAIAGNPRKVERDSLARTLRNRHKIAELRAVQPEWKVIELAAKKKKKAER